MSHYRCFKPKIPGDTHSDLFRMLSRIAKYFPRKLGATCRIFTAKSRIRQIWLPVDHKSTEIPQDDVGPLNRAVLPGQPSRATFAGAPFAIHRLWAMSSIVFLIALISVTSGPNFLACSKMLRGACVCSCGTGTRSLSAIVSLPCCRRLRHEHNPVLISQAG